MRKRDQVVALWQHKSAGLPDPPPAKGLSRINPLRTTEAHRHRLKSKPVNAANPFPLTVRPVTQVMQNLIPKPGQWPRQRA